MNGKKAKELRRRARYKEIEALNYEKSQILQKLNEEKEAWEKDRARWIKENPDKKPTEAPAFKPSMEVQINLTAINTSIRKHKELYKNIKKAYTASK